ncbi:MAG: sigma 54-interacting transcriptional regulator [Deltaproteobacteria bacterium]|nr:sigma 54-interacting transcriptional regulator [Deltaproteobacteria bacterium]
MKPKFILEIRDGGRAPVKLDFTGLEIQIGRATGNDLQLDDKRVSSRHGRIRISEGRAGYQDLGSTNGSAIIRVGRRLPVSRDKNQVWLEINDELQLGDADEPTAVKLLAIEWPQIHAEQTPSRPDATVVAQRALGQMSLVPKRDQLQALLKLLASLRSEQNTETLVERVLRFLLSALAAAHHVECHMLGSTGQLECLLALDQDGPSVPTKPPSSTLRARLEVERQALLIEDVQIEAASTASLRHIPSQALIMAPLLSDKGMVGMLQVESAKDKRFGEAELEWVAVLADQVSAVLNTADLFQRLKDAEARLRGECDYLKRRFGQAPALDRMIGESAAMRELRQQIKTVAPSRTTVLILGETGSGKELVAQALHELSPRAPATFAAVNCSSLARGLLESELFGHLRGAFTGAHRDRKGLFEVAHGGSLLLDEIGDMPMELQPKLLRVLEEGMVLPVGGNRPKSVDVRVIAATHQDLESQVRDGGFRQDLLFRLDVFTLRVPPLRDRRDDIPKLAEHFLARFAKEHERAQAKLSPMALACLQGHDWPGNIRELRNEMERACLMAPAGGTIETAHLSDRHGGGQNGATSPMPGTLKEVMEKLETEVVRQALARHGENRTHCAKELGISRQALITKIAKLGL